MFLILAVLPAGLAAQEEGFDLAVDSAGKAWMGRCRAGTIEIAGWSGEDWQVVHTIETAGPHSLRMTPFGDGIALAWIESAGGAERVAVATADSENVGILRPEDLHGNVTGLAVAGMESGTLALLLSLGAGAGSELRFFEIETAEGRVMSAFPVPAEGAISSLGLLGGADTWLSWQERRGLEIRIAVASTAAAQAGKVRRFSVRGFGGSAAPVLMRSKKGNPVVAWQGTQGRWTAVVQTRGLSDDKLGPVRTAPLPEGISGALSPQAAAGAAGLASAFGWGGGRDGNWFGLRYQLEDSGEITADLHGVSGEHVYAPTLAVDKRSGEIWAWQTLDEEVVEIESRRSSEMSLRTPKRLEPFPVEPDMVYALAFGDSITEGKESPEGQDSFTTRGYLPYLEEVYSERVALLEIIQDGIGGTRTPQGLTRLPVTLGENPHLNYVLILYGTNDAFRNELTPAAIAENLGLLADMVRDAGAIPIVATLLPRFDSGPKERAVAVSEAIYPMARLHGITICDFQRLFPADLELFSDGRLHPNQAGYAKMAEFWFPALVTFQGDVDRSLLVDENDLLLLTAVLQARRGSRGFNPDADFNDDGHVDVADLAFLLERIGRSFSGGID